MGLQSLTIKNKIILGTSLALALSLLTSTVMNNQLVTNLLRDNLEQDELPAILTSIANAIDRDIQIPVQISTQLAENAWLRDFILKGEPETGRPLLVKELQRLDDAPEIAAAFTATSDMNMQVATATEQQSLVVEEIGNNVEQINVFTQLTADAAAQTGDACTSLTKQSERLGQLVNQFVTIQLAEYYSIFPE